MQSNLSSSQGAPRRALVLGGTGAVGSCVLGELAHRQVPTVFSYHRAEARAQALAQEYTQHARQLDLGDPARVSEFARELAATDEAPNVLIHCAVTSSALALADIGLDEWQRLLTINSYSALVLAQQFAPSMAARGGGDVVFVGALDRTQSLPTPAHFAASQGALSTLAMALGKELGPKNIRVNMVALGPLERGLSQAIAPELLNDFTKFSALRRLGSPEEAARAIVWLALENSYMNGRVVSVNGGI